MQPGKTLMGRIPSPPKADSIQGQLEARATPHGMVEGLSQLAYFLPGVSMAWKAVLGLGVLGYQGAGVAITSHIS